MTWFKVDDGLPDHPKVKQIPLRHRAESMGFWALAGAWAAKHNTDGFVPTYMLQDWSATPSRPVAWLVKVGLWVEVTDGYTFHNWLERQPSREEVEEKRADHAAAQRAYQARKREKMRAATRGNDENDQPLTNHADHHSDTADEVLIDPRPVHTRPDPSISTTSPSEKSAPAPRKPKPSPPGFEEFWAVYPRKDDKEKARAVWPAASRKADLAAIVDGARRYRDDPNRDPGYTKLPTTWLNAGSWANGPEPSRLNGRTTTQIRRPLYG